eukprot:3421474-Lingulodinium_polyedra.AAC.1
MVLPSTKIAGRLWMEMPLLPSLCVRPVRMWSSAASGGSLPVAFAQVALLFHSADGVLDEH